MEWKRENCKEDKGYGYFGGKKERGGNNLRWEELQREEEEKREKEKAEEGHRVNIG